MSGASRPISARQTLVRSVRRAGGRVAGSVVAVRTDAPRVAVTFDDGPEPGGTDRVLAALAGAGATATFFVLLTRLRRHRALFDEVVAAGHEIALHGIDHRPLPELPDAGPALWAARAELEDAAGREVRWYRPPYGRLTVRTRHLVRRAGLLPVLWGPTTWDWKHVSTAERLAKSVEGAARGAILLAHDGFAGSADGAFDGPAPELDRGELISQVLAAYAERGLSGCSLGDVLAVGRPVVEARLSG